MTYAEQTWAFIVRILGTHYVIFQTDYEEQAIRFCMKENRPCKVIRTIDDQSIYCNI